MARGLHILQAPDVDVWIVCNMDAERILIMDGAIPRDDAS